MTQAQQPEDSHRALPHSAEAERIVIGSLLLNPATLVAEACDALDPGDFYIPANRTIFAGIAAMHAAGKPVELPLLTQWLADAGELEAVGGPAYLGQIATATATPANYRHYADIVRDKSILRQIIAAASTAAARAWQPEETTAALLDTIQAEFLRIGAANRSGSADFLRPMADGLPETCDKVEAIYHSRGHGIGLPTGIHDLDRCTGGLLPGQYIVIAGRPSMGKTAFGLTVAVNAAAETPVAFFSLEMTYDELLMRALCSEAGINLQRLRDGFLAKEDLTTKVPQAAERLHARPIYIDDTPGLSIQEFRRRARVAKQAKKVGLIVVDYIGLMKSATKRANENRQIEMAEISGGLKSVAKELGLPVVALAQLNRRAEDRGDNRPVLSDLRESGSIEQDADVVCLLYRESYYIRDEAKAEKRAADQDLEPDEWRKRAEIILAKQRNGPTPTLKVRFEPEFARFSNITSNLYSNNQSRRQHP